MNEHEQINNEVNEMSEETLKVIVAEEWKAVPVDWQSRIQNVALLIEDEPNEEVRTSEGLIEGDMLLGLYQGIPLTERGEGYGAGMTMPDTITLYRIPILAEATHLFREQSEVRQSYESIVRIVVRETIWHELGHYFGHDDEALYEREDEGSNAYSS